MGFKQTISALSQDNRFAIKIPYLGRRLISSKINSADDKPFRIQHLSRKIMNAYFCASLRPGQNIKAEWDKIMRNQ
jgi:hypothetical protein